MDELGLKEVSNNPGSLLALNTLPWTRSEIVKLPTSSKTSGREQNYGVVRRGKFGTSDIYPLPPTVDATKPSVKLQNNDGVYILSNSQLTVKVENGYITSLIDNSTGHAREVIPEGGKANQFVIFDDKPLNWQAWDVEVYHLESRQQLESCGSELLESSPHRVSVVSRTKISEHSWIKSTISLSPVYDNQPSYVEIECEVEWRESMKFLKVEFPVNVTNKEASYETQFGVMTRPTHYNTT